MTDPQTCSGKNHLATLGDWCRRHPRGLLTLLTVLALAPFLAKPFNMDDPCYVWAAQHIQSHPADPYGFNVNWCGFAQPMWMVTQNPPLDCYFIALAAEIFGWNEVGIHLMFLLPAIAVILGTFRLARKFCALPTCAAGLALFMPVFLISSTTVMCDVPMLAWWIWAVVFWVEGTVAKKVSKLAVAGCFIALATMTKYNAVCLIPLLAAYSLVSDRRSFRWLICLLIPLATIAAYQLVTKKIYGVALFSQASAYAGTARSTFGLSTIRSSLTALAFTGGCFAPAFFFMPFFWRRRTFGWLAGTATAVATIIIFFAAILEKHVTIPAGQKFFVGIQIVFWAIGGGLLLVLAVREVWRQRDAPSCLLASWIGGVFLFAIFFNWTVNARTLIPMTPAVAILLARCLERRFPAMSAEKNFPRPVFFTFALGVILTLLLVHADFSQAVAVRSAAREVTSRYGNKGGTLWFDGNWGYQFYMEKFGASQIDIHQPRLKSGDLLALPLNNNILRPPDSERSTFLDAIAAPVDAWLTTMSVTCGSGFYAATHGPLPFAFGNVPPEYVCIFAIHDARPASAKKTP